MKLTISNVAKMNNQEALDLFKRTRWPNGVVCIACGHSNPYWLHGRQMWRCRVTDCERQFSVFTGTIFSHAKCPPEKLALAIVMFARNGKGMAALQVCRDIGMQPKSALILTHKLREAISRTMQNTILKGVVEIDGAVFGGYRKRENHVRFGAVFRKWAPQFGQRVTLVCARERGADGRTLVTVVQKESDAIPWLIEHISPGTIIQADGAHAWDGLKELYSMMRIQHRWSFSANMACTNYAESFWAIMRRKQLGVHHRMSKKYIQLYADECAWRQDNKSCTDEEKAVKLAIICMESNRSERFRGYWQPVTLKKRLASKVTDRANA